MVFLWSQDFLTNQRVFDRFSSFSSVGLSACGTLRTEVTTGLILFFTSIWWVVFKVQISPKFHICKFFLWVVNVRLFSIQELSRSASTTIDETFDRDNIIMNTSVYFIGYWSTVRGWSNTPIGGITFDQRNFNQIFNVPLKI